MADTDERAGRSLSIARGHNEYLYSKTPPEYGSDVLTDQEKFDSDIRLFAIALKAQEELRTLKEKVMRKIHAICQ